MHASRIYVEAVAVRRNVDYQPLPIVADRQATVGLNQRRREALAWLHLPGRRVAFAPQKPSYIDLATSHPDQVRDVVLGRNARS